MGVVLKKEIEKGALLMVWEITESEQELMDLCSLPNSEQEELKITGSERRRKEKLAVRALLNEIFGQKVYLGYYDNGRPFLLNSIVEISISHTSKYAAVLTHPEFNVGLDIESVNRDFSAVEKKALSVKEISGLRKKERNYQLAILWSAKESIFKRMSLSNVNYAGQIEIKKFTPKDSGVLEAVFRMPGNEKESVFELKYELFNDHIITWMVG
jgi:4'-phosphopantetheinyl transferase EntD